MSPNFVRFQKIPNQAFAENFTCLSQILVNPLFYLSSYFLFGIPFWVHLSRCISHLWRRILPVLILTIVILPLNFMTYPNSRDISANNRPHAVLATTFLWWTPHLARPPMTLDMEQCSEKASRASLASYRMNLHYQKNINSKLVEVIWFSNQNSFWP